MRAVIEAISALTHGIDGKMPKHYTRLMMDAVLGAIMRSPAYGFATAFDIS
jgi:hypothetical protein